MSSFLYLNQEIRTEDPLIYYINRAGSFEVEANFNIKRNNSYPYCVMHYVVKGSGSVIYRDKMYSVGKGQLFVLNAYEAHHYKTNPEDPMYLDWIEFSGGDSWRLTNAILDCQSPVIDNRYSIIANRYMKRILSFLKRDSTGNSVLISKVIYSLLLSLMDLRRNNKSRDVSKSAAACIKRITNYIEGHLGDDLNVGVLAEYANFNPTYFAKLFHEVTGVTPAKYVQEKRLGRAREFLCDTDMQIDLLAEELGFCNSSHLIRIFKKAEGLTPAEYRRQSILYKLGKV